MRYLLTYPDGCEDEMHLLRDCTWTKEVWNVFLPTGSDQNFYTTSTWDWVKKNLTEPAIRNENWNLVFMACVWEIWKRRIEAILGDNIVMQAVVVGRIWPLISDLKAIFSQTNQL